MIDLDAYFDRIGWCGPAMPTFDALAEIIDRHTATIPFENFDVLLGRPIRLDINALQAKMVSARRGGYCFEHGTLLCAMLEAIGFQPRRHQARVMLHRARKEAPRTHMFLTVPISSSVFVVDAGFGAHVARRPVPLLRVASQLGDDDAHWMTRAGREWTLHSRKNGRIVDCWVSSLEEENPEDFEVANHYLSTSPRSDFVNRIFARSSIRDGSVTLSNRQMRLRQAGTCVTRTVPDRWALRSVLTEHFGFDLPEVLALRVPSIPEWS